MIRVKPFGNWIGESLDHGYRAVIDRVLRLKELGLIETPKNSWGLVEAVLREIYPDLEITAETGDRYIDKWITLTREDGLSVRLVRHGFKTYTWYVLGQEPDQNGNRVRFASSWTLQSERNLAALGEARAVEGALLILDQVVPLIEKELGTHVVEEAFHPTRLTGEPHGYEWMVEATPDFLANWNIRNSIRVRCSIGLPTPFAEVEIRGRAQYLTLTLSAKYLSGEPVLHWSLGLEGRRAGIDSGYWPLAETGEVDSKGWFKITRAPR